MFYLSWQTNINLRPCRYWLNERFQITRKSEAANILFDVGITDRVAHFRHFLTTRKQEKSPHRFADAPEVLPVAEATL
jgi:hypothetical protein